MATWDYLIIGGGASGLSLCWHLANSALRDRRVLVVDRDPHDDERRTFSYWARRPLPFDDLCVRSWDRIRVAGPGWDRVLDLGPYRYRTVRGVDFQHALRPSLNALDTMDVVEGGVDEVRDGRDHVDVRVGAQWHEAGFVFDSRVTRADYAPREGTLLLRQRFVGWEVETDADTFDPDRPVLFDFRTPQRGAVRFFYVLPYCARRALVEYVVYGPDAPDEDLAAYVRDVLGIAGYRVTFEERGVSPLRDRQASRRLGRRILGIGVHGGRLKASTGYAFERIQRDSQAIVRSLEKRGHPFRLPRDPWLFRLLDAVMLRVMADEGERIADLFGAMFDRNPIERVLGFLDEDLGPCETLRLASSLPRDPFVRAVIRGVRGRRA
jgi:lycopene beta-cyclase